MKCVKPVNIGYGRRVPCGRCISCRINRGQQWKDRLLHELDSWKSATFLTLTYSPESYPVDGSLSKDELQRFFKRYRKSLGEERIRYYAVGEYGDATKRAHYHSIVFGGKEEHPVRDLWNKGHVMVGSVTEQSIAYVTDYVNKKLYGKLAREEYGERLPPFALMSKGMGLTWLKENEHSLLINMGLRRQGRVYSMPRYYMRKLEAITDEMKDELMRVKAEDRLDDMAEAGVDPLEEWRREEEDRRQIEADQRFWESIRVSKL